MLIEPAPETIPPKKRASTFVFVMFLLLYTADFVFFAVCLAIYHPVRAYEAALFVGVTTSPVWFFLGKFINNKLQAMNFSIEDWKLTLNSYVSAILLVMGTVYLVNGQFDGSPEQTCEMPVMSKHLVTLKGGSRSPKVYVSICTKSIIPFLELDDEEEVSVRREEYDLVKEGVTTAIITYKSGRYGLPWKVSSQLKLTPDKAPRLAEYLVRFAAELQDADYLAGVAYFKGTGKPKDDAMAVMHFKLAADRGNAVAQHDLAYMYFNGLGDGVKTAAAFELIKQSAQSGYALAQDYLGVMYGDGKDGAPQDWIQSYHWIKLSAQQGYPQAIQDMNYVRAHMTAQQIEEAEKL